jgi:hypothetical protein
VTSVKLLAESDFLKSAEATGRGFYPRTLLASCATEKIGRRKFGAIIEEQKGFPTVMGCNVASTRSINVGVGGLEHPNMKMNTQDMPIKAAAATRCAVVHTNYAR